MAGALLKVIRCDANMINAWIATLVGSYTSGEPSRSMSTVCKKRRNWIVAGIL